MCMWLENVVKRIVCILATAGEVSALRKLVIIEFKNSSIVDTWHTSIMVHDTQKMQAEFCIRLIRITNLTRNTAIAVGRARRGHLQLWRQNKIRKGCFETFERI